MTGKDFWWKEVISRHMIWTHYLVTKIGQKIRLSSYISWEPGSLFPGSPWIFRPEPKNFFPFSLPMSPLWWPILFHVLVPLSLWVITFHQRSITLLQPIKKSGDEKNLHFQDFSDFMRRVTLTADSTMQGVRSGSSQNSSSYLLDD